MECHPADVDLYAVSYINEVCKAKYQGPKAVQWLFRRPGFVFTVNELLVNEFELDAHGA